MANEVKIVLSAKDLASGKISKLKKGISGVNSTLQKSQRGMLAAGAASVAFGALAVRSAANFDKGMREVNTLINVSNDELDSLGGQVRELSKEFGINAVDATKALYSAISAGQKPAEAIEFLGVAAKTSIGGVTDLETAVDGLTSIVNAFGYESSETQDVADIMFETMRRGKTTIGELSDFFFQAAPVASALGVSFKETSAAITTLTLSGTPTRVAMTQVRQAMVALAKPTADMEALFEAVGFESGLAAIRSEGLVGALTKLQKESGATEDEFIKAVGSIDALQAVMGLTGKNTPAFLDNMVAMENAAGNVERAYTTMADSTSQSFALMTAAMEDAKIEIGENLAPAMEEAASQATTLSKAVAWLPSWLTNTAIAAGGLAGAIGISTLAFGQLAKAATPLKAVFSVVAAAGATTTAVVLAAAAATYTLIKVSNDALTMVEKQKLSMAVNTEAWGRYEEVINGVTVAYRSQGTALDHFDRQMNRREGFDSRMNQLTQLENQFGDFHVALMDIPPAIREIADVIDGTLTDSYLSLYDTLEEVIIGTGIIIEKDASQRANNILKQRGLEREAIKSVLDGQLEDEKEYLDNQIAMEAEADEKRLKGIQSFWTLKSAKSSEEFDRLAEQMMALPSVMNANGSAAGGDEKIGADVMRSFKASQNRMTDALAEAQAFLAAGEFSGAQAAATAQAEVDRLLGIVGRKQVTDSAGNVLVAGIEASTGFKGDALGAQVLKARNHVLGGAPPGMGVFGNNPERSVRGENGMQKERLGQGGWTVIVNAENIVAEDLPSIISRGLTDAEQLGAHS